MTGDTHSTPVRANRPSLMRFAFYGRVAIKSISGAETARARQLRIARDVVQPHASQIVAEHFDVDSSRSTPWLQRPQAQALLAAAKNTPAPFDAVIIAHPGLAMAGADHQSLQKTFARCSVQLWVAQLGGPVNPDSDVHRLLLDIFAGPIGYCRDRGHSLDGGNE
ncbi:hypothetical protein E1293_40220 [Actinomadura darangshiensis]|uniref:Resolvase/invertase-type recombinase catalytic domain-containing protein n=1 Tax=Actinomadura darangshiensis TaxID=705336 RepID=A0A4R5A4C3_9ACTN|nr:recombinase family protein [Actinomadura darangshiensis]TDD65499.1 hypothetical protein E1293_40220 [Actinomadura darangshiensis]